MAVEIRIMNSNDYSGSVDLWKSLPGSRIEQRG